MVTRMVLVLALGLVVAGREPAAAQSVVTLPDTSQTTAVTVNLHEQGIISLPATVAFTVTNVSTATVSMAAAVQITDVIRAVSTKSLRVSLRANAPSFTPPVPGATSWAAADVSWTSATWSQGTGSAGTLSSGAFAAVASCGTAGCSTSNLVFTLAPRPAVRRSGGHSLTVIWKIESLTF